MYPVVGVGPVVDSSATSGNGMYFLPIWLRPARGVFMLKNPQTCLAVAFVPAVPAPAQLPLPAAGFGGRTAELARLTAIAGQAPGTGGADGPAARRFLGRRLKAV